MARFVFFGTSMFSENVLEKLKVGGLVPTLIVASPDRRAGRGMNMQSPPVKIWADKNSINVIQPETLDEELIKKLVSENPDLFVVASYGKIIPKNIIDLPPYGSLNVHPSLLPKHRGASPLQEAILEDDSTGVSIILMDEQMDHGPILAMKEVGVNELEEWPPKYDILEKITAKIGGEMLLDLIPKHIEGKTLPMDQIHENATFTRKVTKADGEIMDSDSEEKKWRKYLAYQGWPGTFFFKDNKRYKITKADFTNEKFIILKVIPEGESEKNFDQIK